ncbi:MAG: hypothetical protein HYS13_14575 [Planctomycetia bacterium]|nr:hypothetical protein [Planctomycetia bacterium]
MPPEKRRPIDPRVPLEDLAEKGIWPPPRPPAAPARKIDADKAAAAGIRQIESTHLTIFTDLPESPEVDALPKIFDAAYPQWCQYFGLPDKETPVWRMQAFIMQDRDKFAQAGCLRDELPPFENGYTYGHELFMLDQPSDYYRRHLLLHEGTHGFMYTHLPGDAPAWYMEGMAELLGSHTLQGGKPVLAYFPRSREEVPYHGRIKLIREAYEQNRAMILERVLTMAYRSETEAYAWWWAVAAFLDGHPRYRDRFRKLFVLMKDRKTFNGEFQKLYADDWPELCEEWQVFVAGLDYGYDVSCGSVTFAPGEVLPADGKSVRIDANQGWQSTGLKLEQGKTYKLTASGRFQVAKTADGRTWHSEPQGVSVRYCDGLPIGTLLAAVRPDESDPQSPSALLRPIVVGRETTITPEKAGTLYLRVNEFSGDLADNAGQVEVKIAHVAAAP